MHKTRDKRNVTASACSKTFTIKTERGKHKGHPCRMGQDIINAAVRYNFRPFFICYQLLCWPSRRQNSALQVERHPEKLSGVNKGDASKSMEVGERYPNTKALQSKSLSSMSSLSIS